eukprot:m.84745 g.84745  ORF g.84745 m.84745 type:complete len:68 (+) comp8357_c0_seq1:956-1159(+)
MRSWWLVLRENRLASLVVFRYSLVHDQSQQSGAAPGADEVQLLLPRAQAGQGLLQQTCHAKKKVSQT